MVPSYFTSRLPAELDDVQVTSALILASASGCFLLKAAMSSQIAQASSQDWSTEWGGTWRYGWPHVFRRVLTETYQRERESAGVYAGEVFKDRDDDFPVRAVLPEKKAVKELFHLCRLTTDGVVTVGSERYWLLGYEWPNQGGDGEKGRRADLVGVNAVGGLVVFECKLENNDGPLTAVLEGLDYLSHLTSQPNFDKLASGFTRWAGKPGRVRPSGFEIVSPLWDSSHEVVVLASQAYFVQHRRSQRSPGWELFAALPTGSSSPVIRFAESDFTLAQARWVTG